MTDIHQISSFYFDEFSIYLQIERLCDRLQLATRIEDRRDAVRGLKGLSKVIKETTEILRLIYIYIYLNRNVNLKLVHKV